MSKHKQEESVYQNLWLWPVAYIIVTRPQHLRLKKTDVVQKNKKQNETIESQKRKKKKE